MDATERNGIDAVAAAWIAREDRGPLDAAERAERDRWLAESPRHFGAYARASAVLAWSDRVASAGDQPRRRPTRRWRLFALAAGMAAVLVGAVLLAWPQGTLYRTGHGQVLRVALADGSNITLDAKSQVRVRLGRERRDLELLAGSALFDVAHDPQRPFVVAAGATRVTAVGTRFTVGFGDGAAREVVDVQVSEGAVNVAARDPAIAPARLQAGMRARTRPSVAVEVQPMDPREVARQLLWPEGMLAFNGDTLTAAAEQFRRYSDLAIIIDDPDVGSRRVVGLYPANDPAGFARNVALSLGLTFEQHEDGVRLSAPALHPGSGSAPAAPRHQ